MEQFHEGYREELEKKDLEIKALKEMLNKCEEQRRTAVFKNSKKYLASMADHWKKQSKHFGEANTRFCRKIEELEEKLRARKDVWF